MKGTQKMAEAKKTTSPAKIESEGKDTVTFDVEINGKTITLTAPADLLAADPDAYIAYEERKFGVMLKMILGEVQWEKLRARRDPLEALRFGAMLLNVSQYVDCSPIYGRGKHIVARKPGLKGWLREHCREISYVTAMSYRKLAQTTCQAIGLPEFLPLEWVMPGTEAEDAGRELDPERKAGMKLKRKEFLRQIQACREKLTRLLEGAGNVNRLNAVLDVATQGHRHRVRVKITDADSKSAAERSLDRHLRTALETLQALPPEQSIARQAALLGLLDDLKRQVESRCA